VLSHTGGLQNWRTTDHPLRIHFTPGTQWMYSGEGYSYLQSVVARLTGQDLDTFMRRNVFEPFGMPSTAFSWNAAFAERYATPHNATAAAVDVPRPTPAEVARYGSAGGLWTTDVSRRSARPQAWRPVPPDARQSQSDDSPARESR
jgi:CubicO group peptidase (beta-lactamase class C family)